MKNTPLKLVYVIPALYMAGGVERVVSMKASYFAEHDGYEVTVILTEGKDKPPFFPLSDKIKIVHLDINFEELWSFPLVKKVWVYRSKQRRFRKLLTAELMRIRPDVTVSSLRREINFVTDIKDGSKKIGEMHVPRAHFRNLGPGFLKRALSSLWNIFLARRLRRLDAFVVLTEKAQQEWPEVPGTRVIPNPLSFSASVEGLPAEKRVIAVGRYSPEKGYDQLLRAWAMVQHECRDWRLETFGEGDTGPYERMIDELQVDRSRCILHGRTCHIQEEYTKSSLAVCSSRFEGFGLIIVEALSCGLPVVAFDCPWGPRSIISDGENGLLVENGNVDALAASMKRLMTDDATRQAMSMRAKDMTPRFQIEHVAEMWKSLFEQLLSPTLS